MAGLGGHIPQVEPPAVAAGRQQRAVPAEGHGEHRSAARRDLPPDATPGIHVPELHLALPLLAVEPLHAVRVHGHREQPTVGAESRPARPPIRPRRAGGPTAAPLFGSKKRTFPSIVPTAMRFPSGWKATAVTTEPASIRSGLTPGLGVVHDRAAVEPPRGEPLAVGAEGHVGGQVRRSAQWLSDRLLSAHVPDDRRAQVRAHQGPAVGAERDVVDRARVRPSAGSRTARRSSRSHTKTDPPNEAAASSRPSGLRSSEAAGSSPTDSGWPIGRPVPMSTMDTEPESSLAISVRPSSAKIASSHVRLPDDEGPTDAAAPWRPPRCRPFRERPVRRSASNPG